jgi:GNAT superfamily N-acetyltransferase
MFSPRKSDSDVSLSKEGERVKRIRHAVPQDAPVLAALINDAFKVEAFFKIGDRTSAAEVLQMMTAGQFLVLEDPPGAAAGSVYLKFEGDRAYFGMLSIERSRQGRGLGRHLVDAVEAECREHGCRHIDIHIVNLREELPPFYRRLGYVDRGTKPFPDTDRASRPCHMIVMTKALV